MDIVEQLRLVDIQFWYQPFGHGIDNDLDVPAYELGALSHKAANEIERLRKALQWIAEIHSHGPKHQSFFIARAALKGDE